MIAGALPLLLALASGGAPPGSNGAADDAPAMTLAASLSDDGERLEVVLSPGSAPVNVSSHASLWAPVSLRPRVVIQLQRDGRRVDPCFYPSPSGHMDGPEIIHPGSAYRRSIAISDVGRFFCLAPGRYAARFAYETDAGVSHPGNSVAFEAPSAD